MTDSLTSPKFNILEHLIINYLLVCYKVNECEPWIAFKNDHKTRSLLMNNEKQVF